MSVTSVRPPSHAGRFYTGEGDTLRREVESYIDAATPPSLEGTPRGFVSPHAGFSFSGPTAGHVYRLLREMAPEVVFVIAPSHHSAFAGVSIWPGEAYQTPLGNCPIDRDRADALCDALPSASWHEQAERAEHALEVQVPFIQVACPDARLVPLLMGAQTRDNAEEVGRQAAQVANLDAGRVAFIASSDAYHGHSAETCQKSDDRLAADIEAMGLDALYDDVAAGRAMACGYGPIASTMVAARALGARAGTILDRSTSADRVSHLPGDYIVGYVAAAFS